MLENRRAKDDMRSPGCKKRPLLFFRRFRLTLDRLVDFLGQGVNAGRFPALVLGYDPVDSVTNSAQSL